MFGNALGDSLAAANSGIPGPVSESERATIMGYFADGSNNGSVAFHPDMSATTASNLLADLGLGNQVSGGGTLYADASAATRRGIASDAGGGGRLSLSGGEDGGRDVRTLSNDELLARGKSLLLSGAAPDSEVRFGGVLSTTTVEDRAMTAAEIAAFDAASPGAVEAAANGVRYYGSLTPYQPTFWEKTWLSPEVQHVMGNSITGKLVGGVANTLGTAWASFASRGGYNPATGKNLNLVQQRDGRIDTLINAAATVVTGGASTATRAELQAMKAETATVQVSRRAELNAKFGRSGNLDQDINARGTLDPRHEIDRLVAEGHAPGRHGERVSERALDERALYKYDPITGTTTDYFTRGTHGAARDATKFTTNRSLLQAEAYVRGTPEFAAREAAATAAGETRFAVNDLLLEDALGPNYLTQVFGKTRIGPVGTGTHAPVNFTDGTITGVFRKSTSGGWNLHTMYPGPKP